MAEPTGSRNISQSLFMMDEKLMTDPKSQKALHSKMMADSVSGWNSISEPQGIEDQLPAYLNQSRLSTYYQDNPWSTLQFSDKFGVSTMGGPVNPSLPPGSRPGNILKPGQNALTGYAMGNPVQNAMIGSGYIAANQMSADDTILQGTPYNKVPIRQPESANYVKPMEINGVDVPSFMTGFGKHYTNQN